MTRAELQALIADGKLDKALREVIRQAERSGEADWLHRALHLSGRFRELQQREHANLISFEEASRSRAQIAHALLALVQELPEPGATSPKALFQGPWRWPKMYMINWPGSCCWRGDSRMPAKPLKKD